MRVAHVIARLNVGGPAAILQTLVSGGRPDIEHIVLAGDAGADEAEWSSLRGTISAVVPVPGLGPAIDPLRDAAALARTVAQLRRFKPDIVHTHTAKGGAIGRVGAELAGVPARVHTFHGHVLHGYFGVKGTTAYTTVERRLAIRSSALVAVGVRVRDDLLAAGVGHPDQYRVIPPGVAPPSAPSRDRARASLGLRREGSVVSVVGRLTAIKRLDRAVDVARRLADGGHAPTLLIVGGGELESDVRRRLADAGVPARVLGWVADVGTVMAAADLMLLTSDNEGMPVGLIEAAHLGIPAVATDVGSVAEVVLDGRTGRVVPPSVEAIADACRQLLDDDALRARMGRAAIGHARARFGVDTMRAAYDDLYDEITDSRART